MTTIIFLLLASILIVVLIVIKVNINRQNVLSIPVVSSRKMRKNEELNYKSAMFDTLGNLHILTNRGIFLKTSDKFISHPLIPSDAVKIGYYTKTHELFYIDSKQQVYFIDENNDMSYTLDQLFNLPKDYYKLINSVVPNNTNDGTSLIVLSNGKVIEYSHSNEKIINENQKILGDFDFVISDPVTHDILVINRDTFRSISNKNKNNKLLGSQFSNFFSDSKIVINNFNYAGITGPSDNDSLLKKDTYIENEIHNYTIPRDGEYTIKLVGAGTSNGGAGTLLTSTLKLKERDNLKFLIGNAGFRFPCQENRYEERSKKLQLQASCSGAGASSLLVNNKLTLVAAGGGGWSSGILKCPINGSESNSGSTFVVPIKSIIIHDTNIPQITSIKSHNWVKPKYSIKSGNIIEFTEALTDYTIKFDKTINNFTIVTPYSRQIVLDYNSNILNNKNLIDRIYSKTLLTLENNEIPKKNNKASSGFSISKSNDLMELKRVSVEKSQEDHNIAYGGLGGGGFAAERISSKVSNCGGGGGYIGGNSCVSNFVDDTESLKNIVIDDNSSDNTITFNGKSTIIPLTCGSAGTSFNNNTDTLKISGFNRNSGYAIIYPPNESSNSKIDSSLNLIEKNTLEGIITKDDLPIVEIDIPDNKERINLTIHFYPDTTEPVIRVSTHSFLENDWINQFTYFQNGFPYQSDEIVSKKVESHIEALLDFYGTPETEALVYTSNEEIKHQQSFNTIPNLKTFFVLMKFTGKYKITIT